MDSYFHVVSFYFCLKDFKVLTLTINTYNFNISYSMSHLMMNSYSLCMPEKVFTSPLFLKYITGASLVAQWLRIHLPMQGTQVRALVREDPTCLRATKPMRHSYWACALEPTSHNYWAHVPQLLKPARLEPVLCNKRSQHNEKPAHHNKE